MAVNDELAKLHEENARLRREVARMRDARNRAEDLNGVMATRLANQGREIAKLKQKLYDVTVLD
jgi:chromosome segregation ATPase